jgi:hypothetical protein
MSIPFDFLRNQPGAILWATQDSEVRVQVLYYEKINLHILIRKRNKANKSAYSLPFA